MVSGGDLNVHGAGTGTTPGVLTLSTPTPGPAPPRSTAAGLVLQNTNAYSGATTVGGAVTGGNFPGGSLTLNVLGTAANSTSFTINQNSTLTLDNSAVQQQRPRQQQQPARRSTAARSPSSANNTAGTASQQSLGTITLASGQNVINAGYTAAAVQGASSVGDQRGPGAHRDQQHDGRAGPP